MGEREKGGRREILIQLFIFRKFFGYGGNFKGISGKYCGFLTKLSSRCCLHEPPHRIVPFYLCITSHSAFSVRVLSLTPHI